MVYSMKNKEEVVLEVSKSSLKYDYTPNEEVPEEFKELALKIVENINDIIVENTLTKKEVGFGKAYAVANSKAFENTSAISGIISLCAVTAGVLTSTSAFVKALGTVIPPVAMECFRDVVNSTKRAYRSIDISEPKNKYMLVVVDQEITQLGKSVVLAVPEVFIKYGFSKHKVKAVGGGFNDWIFYKKGKNGNIYVAVIDDNATKKATTFYLLCVKDNERNNAKLNETSFSKFDDLELI